jgi:hypothetical protein
MKAQCHLYSYQINHLSFTVSGHLLYLSADDSSIQMKVDQFLMEQIRQLDWTSRDTQRSSLLYPHNTTEKDYSLAFYDMMLLPHVK